MFGFAEPETLVIVSAKDTAMYAKQLSNLVSTNDDEGESVVGVVDGSVQAIYFDEAKFKANPLSSAQKIVFVGSPKFTKDDLTALDSLATDRSDSCGIHIRVHGKQAHVDVDRGFPSKESYWEFLDLASSKGIKFPDLLSGFRRRDVSELGSDSDKHPAEKQGAATLLEGLRGGAKAIANVSGEKVALARNDPAMRGQRFQLAIRVFYLEWLRGFMES